MMMSGRKREEKREGELSAERIKISKVEMQK